MTAECYGAYYENTGRDMKSFTMGQIKTYMSLAAERNIKWAKQ
jgi:hypothetical protein